MAKTAAVKTAASGGSVQGRSRRMKAVEVFAGSDGEATKRFYAALEREGHRGIVAVNLFRAQKCSTRAKVYRGGIRGRGSYKAMAYDRKNWSLSELCKALSAHGDVLGITYGWKQDPATLFGEDPSWVLYVDLPEDGQVSFHARSRGEGPEYAGEWDQQHGSQTRILQFCDRILRLATERQPQIQT
jgi:hypothetical protein